MFHSGDWRRGGRYGLPSTRKVVRAERAESVEREGDWVDQTQREEDRWWGRQTL